MKFIHKIFCLTLTILPLLSHAEDFKIKNATNFDVSFQIEGHCSTAFGTIPRYTMGTIPEKFYNDELSNCKYCDVIMYAGSDCHGLEIARIGLGPYGIFYMSGSLSDGSSLNGVSVEDILMRGSTFNLSLYFNIKEK